MDMTQTTIYTVHEICGDYAILIDENGEKFDISVFLLPHDLMVGDNLQCVNMLEYQKI